MKTLNILSVIFFSLFLFSCEDAIDIDLKEGKQALVVEGWLTNKPQPHYVKLYYTAATSANAEFQMVAGASLTLKDDAGNSEQLREVSPGKFEISSIHGVDGRVYTLDISTPDGNYEAVALMKRISVTPDSLTFKYEEKSAIYEYEGYYPRISGQELEGKGDYMQIRLYKNGKYLNSDGDFNLFEDKWVDANYIDNAELAVERPFSKSDTIKAEVWSLTEDSYRFWVDIQTQLQNGQLFASPLANSRTNVKKVSAGARDVIGYFGASLVTSAEAEIK